MSDKLTFKSWLWETTPKGEDNIKHFKLSSKVDMISIPIEENDLSTDTSEEYPPVLDTLMEKLEFRGNIKLSASGKSFNLFRDKLEDSEDSSLVRLSMDSPF